MTYRCPCCGSVVDKVDPAIVLNELRCGPQMRKFLNGLGAAFGRRVSKAHMIDFMYGADPDGGPLNASNILNVFKSTSKDRLAKVGIEIITIWGDGMRMQWIQEKANVGTEMRGLRGNAAQSQ